MQVRFSIHERPPYLEDETILPPEIREILFEEEVKVDIPKYNVVLYDDNEHTYDYVIDMLMHIFGYNDVTAFQMACEVDVLGRVIVYVSNRENAEYKRDLILKHGPDWRLDKSKSSMYAAVELAENSTDIQ